MPALDNLRSEVSTPNILVTSTECDQANAGFSYRGGDEWKGAFIMHDGIFVQIGSTLGQVICAHFLMFLESWVVRQAGFVLVCLCGGARGDT
jgi:hypothetical protein